MILFLLGLLWGRIINQIASLLLRDYVPLESPSYCAACQVSFAWWQRVPFVSYIVLHGRCPECHEYLSVFNPLTEILAGVTLPALYYSPVSHYFFAYFIFFSALLITFRTDIETMLISRACTVWMIPLALVLSLCGLLPLSMVESMFGVFMGYFILFCIAKLFYWITKREGMGAGDAELLACIGAFTGPAGCWLSLLLGSTLGSLVGLILLIFYKRSKNTPITFGPFLSLAALIYVLAQEQLIAWLLYTHL